MEAQRVAGNYRNYLASQEFGNRVTELKRTSQCGIAQQCTKKVSKKS